MNQESLQRANAFLAAVVERVAVGEVMTDTWITTRVASINAELKVGSVAETITVTGETPLVDVQSAAVQKVVTKEVVDAIPTGRLGINLAAIDGGDGLPL